MAQPGLKTHTVGIIGVGGYTGQELAAWLARHPRIQSIWGAVQEPEGYARRLAGWPASQPFSTIVSLEEAPDTPADAVFLCLPHGVTAEYLLKYPQLLERLVIDLSGDFRLKDPAQYRTYYGHEHPAPDLLEQAQYGLMEVREPGLGEGQTGTILASPKPGPRTPRRDLLWSNPGCYPTSVIVALAPFMGLDGLSREIVVHSQSGVTGAGKTPTERTHFVTVDENVIPYSPGRVHRHVPEMEQELGQQAGQPVTIAFTPILIPVQRGILSIMTLQWDRKPPEESTLRETFERFYTKAPFVRLMPPGSWPHLHLVQRTNYVAVGLQNLPGMNRTLVMSAIDNLVKGAAGSAIQIMNYVFGFGETDGLE